MPEGVRSVLEMTSRDALRPAPKPDLPLRLDRMRDCPASFFRYLYTEVGRQWRWLDRLGWTDDEIRAHLSRSAISMWLLTVRGTPAGYFELAQQDDGAVEIAYFGLLPEFTDAGLGGWMLTEATGAAWGLDATRVWLHTCTLDHPGASQDLYLTLWRRHRVELCSILDQVPNLRQGGRLLLYLPRDSPFTSCHYLPVGGTWLGYLYGDLKLTAVIWSAGGFDCRVEGQAFVCRNPARADCYASGRCQPLTLPFESTVLLRYVRAEGRFVLQRELPPDLAPGPRGRYDPGDWIVPGPRSRWARELPDQPELMAAFFPGRERGLERR